MEYEEYDCRTDDGDGKCENPCHEDTFDGGELESLFPVFI